MTKLMERLSALDDRVLPRSLTAERVAGSQILYFLPAACMGLLAWQAESRWERLAFLLLCASLLVRTGRDVERLRVQLESEGGSLPLARARRWAPAAVFIVALSLIAVSIAVHTANDPIALRPAEARAVVDKLVEASVIGDGSGVCQLALNKGTCVQIHDDTAAKAPSRPDITASFTYATTEIRLASFVIRESADSKGCAVTLLQHDGELRVVNPVYWANGC